MSTRRNQRQQVMPEETLKPSILKGLSDIRRAQISDAVTKKSVEEEESRITPIISHSSAWREVIKKTASNSHQPVTPTSYGRTDLMGPEVYSPLFLLANLNLPRDRVTLNAWNRVFYDTNPLVRNAINLHASYPISKINISHPVKEVQDFFYEMAERIDLYSVIYNVALEYWKMGEVFPYAEIDKDRGMWKRVTVLNPDYVYVKTSPVGNQKIISLKPDLALKKLISSNDPSDLNMKKRIPKHIIDYVKKDQFIPLDNFNVSHLKLLSSPYDVRGTSIIVSVYKDLMLYDKLRESKFAQADGMVNPLTLVKLGGSNDYRPTQSDLESFRQVLEEAQYDKDFKIVTHDGVTIERIGFSGSVMEIGSDIEHIYNNLYTGLMMPKSLIDQEGASYASSSIGLEVLRQRYDLFRNMIKKWIEQKIFAPICELQEFYEYKNGQKVLQVPTVDFNHMNLYDMSDYINGISQFVGNKQISLQSLYRTLGLGYDEERRRLKEEAIHEAIRLKEAEIMGAMRLRELENLDADSVIPEPEQTTPVDVGGQAGGEALPGVGVPPAGLGAEAPTGGDAPPGLPPLP